MQNTETKATNDGGAMTVCEVVNFLIDNLLPPMPREQSRPINSIQAQLDSTEKGAAITLTRKQWGVLADALTKHPMPPHRAFTEVIDAIEEKAKDEQDADADAS